MPKKSSFRCFGLKKQILRHDTSSESDENLENNPKRIRRDESSIVNPDEESDLAENEEALSPRNDPSSEDVEQQSCPDDLPISKSEGDQDSNGIVENKIDFFSDQPLCSNGYGFNRLSTSFLLSGDSSEDEDYSERSQNYVSRVDDMEIPEDDQNASFINRILLDHSNAYVEDLKDRIRIVSFNVQRTEIVFMDHPVSLPLYGHLKVTLLTGKATIHGFELKKKKPVVVFSQKQTGILSVDSLPFEKNNLETKRKLRRLLKNFLFHVDTKTMKEKFKGHLRHFTVVVALQELPLPPALQFLQLYSNEAISFKKINSESESLYTSVLQNEEHVLSFCDGHEELLHVVERHLRVINKKKQPEVNENTETDYSDSWSSESDSENALDSDYLLTKVNMKNKCNKNIAQTVTQTSVNESLNVSGSNKLPESCILIYGPKKTGKSTMLRYFINKFLNTRSEVFFLDTDPGQTEFTPPGVVSLSKITEPLFGPPYTHIRKPLKTIFTGTITAETSPPMHIRSVIKLISFFNENYPNSLLLVNTMGWISGIGEMMLQVITKHLKPTVEIQLSENLKPLDYSVEGNVIKCLVGFDRNSYTSTNKGDFRPADLRDWALLSYLGECQNYFHQPTYINAMRPACVCWDDIFVYNFNKRLPYNRYYEALNCSIVALCHVDDSYLLLSEFREYPNTLDDEPDNECLGFGLVRALDEGQHLIYIVTPLDLNSLRRVNAILSGNIIVPRSVLLNQPIYDKELDYTDVSGRTKEGKPIRRRSRISNGHNNSVKKSRTVQ